MNDLVSPPSALAAPPPCTCHVDRPAPPPTGPDAERRHLDAMLADAIASYLKAVRTTRRAGDRQDRVGTPGAASTSAAAFAIERAAESVVTHALVSCAPGADDDSPIVRYDFDGGARAAASGGLLFLWTGMTTKDNPSGLVVIDVRQVVDLDATKGGGR